MVALLIPLLIQLASSPGPCDLLLMHPAFEEISMRKAAGVMSSGR